MLSYYRALPQSAFDAIAPQREGVGMVGVFAVFITLHLVYSCAKVSAYFRLEVYGRSTSGHVIVSNLSGITCSTQGYMPLLPARNRVLPNVFAACRTMPKHPASPRIVSHLAAQCRISPYCAAMPAAHPHTVPQYQPRITALCAMPAASPRTVPHLAACGRRAQCPSRPPYY